MGRTGTFIGLDYLYDEGKANNAINVYKCVERLREQRVHMVQKKVDLQLNYVITHAPRRNVINNVVSMQRPPYCIVSDDLY